VTSPQEITARHVRKYLAQLVGTGKSDTTVHDHARTIKTLLRFWHAEGYLAAPIIFAMPRLLKKRLPVLTADQLKQVLSSGLSSRDSALIMFIADSGLRRAEVCALNWEDIDIASGLLCVRRGKGGKTLAAVIGAGTRRALLAYRRTVKSQEGASPVFLARSGTRLTPAAVMLLFQRLSQRTGIHLTAHALRRTFVILSLRGGMDVLHLQALLGHSSLEMVRPYAQMIDDDLLQDHHAHSPIDNLARLRQESAALRNIPKSMGHSKL
jgi:site-specific recombinase XerD